MSTSRFASVSIGVVIACGVAVAQQITRRVSVDSAGAQVNGGQSWIPSISADGRFVGFESETSGLVVGDTNGRPDCFVRDLQTGTTERVSVATGGAQGNGDSVGCLVSADGRFVAFSSLASNLVAGDTNGWADAFVRDRASGTTERVSVATGGAEGDLYSGAGSISTDGRFVVFASYATNLVMGDTNSNPDVFVRDRQNGTTESVSVDPSGAQGNNGSEFPSISADGRFVSFQSYASTLVAGDTNVTSDVFVRDRQSGTTELVSMSTSGVQGNATSYLSAISADGRFVAFTSGASNLVAGDTNAHEDIFVRDRTGATTERVSVDSAGAQGNHDSWYSPSISADGSVVVFQSFAWNLVAGDTNGYWDVFVRDRTSGITERANVATGGAEANARGYYSAVSADGRFVAFDSQASNLVAGDTNGYYDVFVRDRRPPPDAYCTSGTSSHGCRASISASLNPSLSQASACNIAVANVEGQKLGILFYGIDNTGFTFGAWAPGSTSYLCVKHPTQRTPIQNSGGTINACDGSFVLDWNAYQSTHPLALGNPWSIGDKVYVQAWFRDPPAVKSTNLSNALEMTYVP
jgi:Tol biopolymer transport system component